MTSLIGHPSLVPLVHVSGLPHSMSSLSNLLRQLLIRIHMFMHLTDSSVAAHTGCSDAYTLILIGLVLCSGELCCCNDHNMHISKRPPSVSKMLALAVDLFSILQWRRPFGPQQHAPQPTGKDRALLCVAAVATLE